MKGAMRMLIMFGPMIFRQFQKYQRNKKRNQTTQYKDNTTGKKQEGANQQNG